jgi:hypothetical protein
MSHEAEVEIDEHQRIGKTRKRRRGPEGIGAQGSEEELVGTGSEQRGSSQVHRDDSALGLGPRKRMYATVHSLPLSFIDLN